MGWLLRQALVCLFLFFGETCFHEFFGGKLFFTVIVVGGVVLQSEIQERHTFRNRPSDRHPRCQAWAEFKASGGVEKQSVAARANERNGGRGFVGKPQKWPNGLPGFPLTPPNKKGTRKKDEPCKHFPCAISTCWLSFAMLHTFIDPFCGKGSRLSPKDTSCVALGVEFPFFSTMVLFSRLFAPVFCFSPFYGFPKTCGSWGSEWEADPYLESCRWLKKIEVETAPNTRHPTDRKRNRRVDTKHLSTSASPLSQDLRHLVRSVW